MDSCSWGSRRPSSGWVLGKEAPCHASIQIQSSPPRPPTLSLCLPCAKELVEIKVHVSNIKDLVYCQRVVSYENSENIDANGKEVNNIEDEVVALKTMIKDIQLLMSNTGSPQEEQSKSEIKNSGNDLNNTTDPTG